MDEIEVLKRRFERERKARKQAEAILEAKALDLFNVNEDLRKLNESLEQKVKERTVQLARSEDKYRGIIEGMELGLLEVDLNQKVLKAYDWFCDMTGYLPEELEGKNALQVLLPDGKMPTIMRDEDGRRQRGQAGVYEVQIKKKDGSLIWVLISGAPVMNMEGEVIGSLGIHYDITARKKLEEELKAAKHVAEAAREAEKQFLARMSHEIRTPLNAIIGMTHLLYDTRPNIQQRDYLDGLRTSADLLLKLISDILDISKIEAGEIKVNAKEFDLPGVLKSLQKTFQLKTEKENIEILIDIEDDIENLIIGDELLLNQILLNLMGNAVKFTDDGEVGVRVRRGEQIKGRTNFEFEVFDTGIGIPTKELDMIFENFKQADHEGKYLKGGTGLGLAICKQLIELQGGKISVASQPDTGTNFYFNLPLIETDKKSIIKKLVSDFMSGDFKSDHRLLIVEDNMMNQKYITNLLKKWSVKYELANHGMEAVEMARKQKFDLVFMDISMPIMDGYEATIQIRSQKNLNQNTPIIALTASAILSQKNKALAVGMNDFLAKPFKPKQLREMISKHAGKHAQSEVIALVGDKEFEFSNLLNCNYLNDLYEGDLEYAADMFETFLDFTVKELPSLRPLVESGDLVQSRKLAHKLKPTFAMVGLTDLQRKMLKIEKMTDEETDILEILLELKFVEENLKKLVPVLQLDLKKMKSTF